MSIDDIMGLFGTTTVQSPTTDLLTLNLPTLDLPTLDLPVSAPPAENSHNSDDGFGDFEDFQSEIQPEL